MDVSVIIVNYNTWDYLKQAIQSVRQYTFGIHYEIIVIDNGSSDDSVRCIREHFPDVHCIASDVNLGFGKANNIGMEKAKAEYLLLLNPDTRIQNNVIKNMYDSMCLPENKDVAVCGATLVDEDSRPVTSYGNIPALPSMIVKSFPLANFFLKSDGVVTRSLGRKDVGFITGADFFVRKSIIERVGKFDEKYFAYYEETDLCKRFKEAGYRCMILLDMEIIHLEGKSFRQSWYKKKIRFESSLYFLHKFSGRSKWYPIYCIINEIKYRAYRMFYYSKSETAVLLKEMGDLAYEYRKK